MKIFATCVFPVLYLVHVSMVSCLVTDHACTYFEPSRMEPFNKTLYVGQWYVHQVYDWGTSSTSGTSSALYDCYVQIRTPDANGNHDIMEILVKPNVEPRLQFDGKLTFEDDTGFYTYSSTRNSFTGEYYILGTDYSTYAIEWNCVDQTSGSKCAVYVMVRVPVVLTTTQTTINGILDAHHIDRNDPPLRTLLISSCPEEFLPGGGGGPIGGLLGIIAGLLGAILKNLLLL